MSEIESLLSEYEKLARQPWQRSLAGAQRVWFAIYDPAQERRLRLRVEEFAIATQKAGHGWKLVDITNAFAEWMSQHEYREAYFEQPEDMELALQDFTAQLVERLTQALQAPDAGAGDVVAILGSGALFGLTRTSVVLEKLTDHIRGRLLVFFPGHREGSNYRLLDARDGFNYLAIPIEAAKLSRS